MLKSILDFVMRRRARQLMELVGEWLPAKGTVLDLGSGTGHLAVQVENESGLAVTTADVSDLHVVGQSPILIGDGELPFDEDVFSAAMLIFMLAYPKDPVGVLKEVARVTRGPIILVQSVYAGCLGYTWLRIREFLWTFVAFSVAKAFRYVPPAAEFKMQTIRFYTDRELRRDLASAGLRIRQSRRCSVLPGSSLVVAGLMVDRND